jgi:hypothetical protein
MKPCVISTASSSPSAIWNWGRVKFLLLRQIGEFMFLFVILLAAFLDVFHK